MSCHDLYNLFRPTPCSVEKKTAEVGSARELDFLVFHVLPKRAVEILPRKLNHGELVLFNDTRRRLAHNQLRMTLTTPNARNCDP